MNEIIYKGKLYKIVEKDKNIYRIQRYMNAKNREIIEVPVENTEKYEILKVK